MDLTSRLLSKYDQIVIYGAKGWVGRSAVALLSNSISDLLEPRILLIGSKTESSQKANLPLDIYSSEDAEEHLGKNVLFLNSAYLRREKLIGITSSEFEEKNTKIMKFGLDLIKRGQVKTFINLSSGVANQGTIDDIDSVTDPYAKCKIRDEFSLYSYCERDKVHFINCRIYAMSGEYINELKNLALTSFIDQAVNTPHLINVKSPSTLRTYVDSIDLVKVLFHLSLNSKNYKIDSGGSLTSLEELARIVEFSVKQSQLKIPKTFDKSADYFGNFLEFNYLAEEHGVVLKNLSEQVQNTLKAFSKL